jgi:hypothetical protein
MFDTEQDLVDTFQLLSCTFLRKLYGKPVSRHFALREFDSHHGVADIVVGTFKPYLSSRWTRKLVNENWIAPLYRLSDGSIIQIDTYMDQFCVSRRMARRQIQEYINASFLEPVSSDSFRVLRTYKPIVSDVVSIEAKLKDWKKALSQALRYRRFSEYVFVLLDEDYIWPALKCLELFEDSNVGLISLEAGMGDLHFHHIPDCMSQKQNYSYNRLNELAYSYFLKAYATA